MAFHLKSFLFGIGLAVLAFVGLSYRQQTQPTPRYEYGELRVIHRGLNHKSRFTGRFYESNKDSSMYMEFNKTNQKGFMQSVDVLNYALTQLPEWELCQYTHLENENHSYLFRRKQPE